MGEEGAEDGEGFRPGDILEEDGEENRCCDIVHHSLIVIVNLVLMIVSD